MPDSYPDYPSHVQLLQYFNDYVDHFDLRKYIQFNSKVQHIEKLKDESWQIKLSNGDEIRSQYLLLSNGHHSVPRYPDLNGEFTGRFLHSHDYKNNESFKGERV